MLKLGNNKSINSWRPQHLVGSPPNAEHIAKILRPSSETVGVYFSLTTLNTRLGPDATATIKSLLTMDKQGLWHLFLPVSFHGLKTRHIDLYGNIKLSLRLIVRVRSVMKYITSP